MRKVADGVAWKGEEREEAEEGWEGAGWGGCNGIGGMSRCIAATLQVGVVHRDLKPENICFTHQDQSQIKLIDMGAAGFDSPAGLSELCGTPLYAAPEITPWYFADNPKAAAKCPRYGREVDYWSLGIALFVMLSGEAPFEQDQPVELLLAEVRRGKLDFSGPLWSKVTSLFSASLSPIPLTIYPSSPRCSAPGWWIGSCNWFDSWIDRMRISFSSDTHALKASRAVNVANDQ